MSDDIIDMDDVMERVQDDRELLMELLDIFEEDYLEKRKDLQEAITGGDFEQIRNVIHSMKGAAGNISARMIHTTCDTIEKAAESNNMDVIQEAVPRLEEQFTALQGYITQLKAQS